MTKDKADIWMPLYIGDYLADTTRLTTEQHGAYLLLIMDYWKSGRLPDNDQVLCQITRMKPDAWSNARAMLEKFFSIENGLWIHYRIEREMESAIENKQKKVEKAQKAAQARWSKEPENAPSITTSNAHAMPENMLVQCPSPSPSPSPLSSSAPSPSSSKNLIRKKSPTKDLPDGFDEFYETFDKKVQRLDAEKSWRRINPNADLVHTIIESARDYVRATPDKKYRKNPATWLNGQCWNDEVIETRQKTFHERREEEAQREIDAFVNGTLPTGRIIDVN